MGKNVTVKLNKIMGTFKNYIFCLQKSWKKI